MKIFATAQEVQQSIIFEDHDGSGPIAFRRLFTRSDFKSTIDFVDYTIISPGSTIGLHEHDGNEEMYLIAKGEPLTFVGGQGRRLMAGSVAVVHSGQSHMLVNDTGEDVVIFVVQVSYS